MAGDQLSNPLVDFPGKDVVMKRSWGSTLKPPGRLLSAIGVDEGELGINSQTPW